MAREIKLLFFLWLVVACLEQCVTQTEGPTTVTSFTPTTAADPSTAPTTTAPADPSTAPTTTAPADPSTAPTTTAPADPSTAPTTTAPADPSTAPTTTAPADPSTAPTTTAPADPSTAPTTTAPADPSTAPTTTAPADPSTAPTTTAPADPSTAPTTTAPADPSTAPTTTAPADPSTAPTTAAPGGPSTAPTTTAPGGPSTAPTTAAPGGPSTAPTTASPGGPSTAPATTTPVPTTTKLPGPCDRNPCKDGSTCKPGSSGEFVCSCLAGDDYDYEQESCVSAKVFPGELNLPGLPYHPNMKDKTSAEFQNASNEINSTLFNVFSESGFSRSILLELIDLSSKDSKVMSRAGDGVSATVEMIFTANTDINTAQIKDELEKAKCPENCLLGNSSFTATDLCESKTCDTTTTTCLSGDGSFNCTCLPDFIETNLSNRMCIACPDGQKAEGSKKCVDCSFGYSGFACQDSWLLKLVIVSSVLGGLLLITLILLPILASKSSKKSSKKDKNADIGKSYISHPPAKQPFVNGNLAQPAPSNGLSAFANAGVPRIPRATTTNSWDSRSNLEMTPSNSRQNLIPAGRNSRFYNDQDDMNPNAQVRPQSNVYAQARPLNNPYTQSAPQTSPYAQSQGHSNPYYTHDNGRRFN